MVFSQFRGLLVSRIVYGWKKSFQQPELILKRMGEKQFCWDVNKFLIRESRIKNSQIVNANFSYRSSDYLFYGFRGDAAKFENSSLHHLHWMDSWYF
jgi:hypothetical protein